jgi:glucosylglycerate phosphorylase
MDHRDHTDESRKTKQGFLATHTVHFHEPDYSRPIYVLPEKAAKAMLDRLGFLYGEKTAQTCMEELERIIKVYYAHKPMSMIERESTYDPRERFTEKDIILITYGDLLQGDQHSPLHTLADFCDTYLQGTINTLHILPFFPFSSDRGFSIIDFEAVDPNLGSWQDIEELENRYQLMFDGVFNHVSAKSKWFQEFLNRNRYYKDYFIYYKNEDEFTPEQRQLVFRPRTSSLFTPYQSLDGPVHVWTTFSADQIDLNYHNPDVLLRVIEILLYYVRHGADIIRLDAITYIWREPGTSCVHLAQTHEIVKLFRDILDTVAPGVALITETNVPHEENISYFGQGDDEAMMVYNFALPPLTLYTFYSENATVLSEWADRLEPPSETTYFFNFLDSHDGVGLMGVKNILSKEQIEFMVEQAREHGGLISYKSNGDGSREPYEINITWFSALNREDSGEGIAFQVKRFVASRSIALVLKGVPGIYLLSLLGTVNDISGVLNTKQNRAINRTVMNMEAIRDALDDPFSKISYIDRELGGLILIRTARRAFHPVGKQNVLFLHPRVFAVLRRTPEGGEPVLTLTNVSRSDCDLRINLDELYSRAERWYDFVGGRSFQAEDGYLNVRLEAYDVVWLSPLRSF